MLLLVIVNVKSLPTAWTISILYQLRNLYFRRGDSFRRCERLPDPSAPWLTGIADTVFSQSSGNDLLEKISPSSGIFTSDIFAPAEYSTYASLAETDYNLHKSNSTYFADLDIARSKLIARLLGRIWPLASVPIKVTPPVVSKVNPAVIIGSVHTSFHREIKPLASYRIRSRVLAWDNRWIYVGSWFLAGKKRGSRITTKDSGTGHAATSTVLASSLTKYIVKRGRITIRPEDIWKEAGLVPGNSPDDETADDGRKGDEIEEERLRGMRLVSSGWSELDDLMRIEGEAVAARDLS